MEHMASELLKRGADPNRERGTNGSTPLHLAIAEENLNVVKMLLEKGACLETKDDCGCTPFLVAVKENENNDIFRHLLDHAKVNVDAVTDHQKTALHLASRGYDEEIMTALIGKGLSVAAEDKDGWTPLHEASYHGSREAAEFLIENGQSLFLHRAAASTMQVPGRTVHGMSLIYFPYPLL